MFITVEETPFVNMNNGYSREGILGVRVGAGVERRGGGGGVGVVDKF